MKFLLDIPLVMSVATWIWGADVVVVDDNIMGDGADDAAATASTMTGMVQDVSPEGCVLSFPFMPTGCWTRALAKCVGVAIVVLSCVNKVPIMKNLLQTKSIAGLSRGSIYGEMIVYANCAFYGILEGHPFSAYGENVSMTIQSIIIMLMIWSFSSSGPKAVVVSFQERILVVLISIMYVIGVTRILPSEWYYMLMASIYPIMLYSRFSQIWTTYQIKHTGSLSIITTSMSFAGSSVRILTTIKEIGWDFAVLSGYLLSVCLNSILMIQYFYYLKRTNEFVKEQVGEKQQEEMKKKE